MDLFGKKKLEDDIKKLEFERISLLNEKEELLRILEKREEKIRKFTSAYQEASLALKAVEQKMVLSPPRPSLIASERIDEEKTQGVKLTPRQIEKIMLKLRTCTSAEEDVLTAYLPDSIGLPPEANNIARFVKSERGWIVLQFPQLFTLLLIPPFPIKESSSNTGCTFQLEPLREIMETPVLVTSAHAGDTFLGIALGKSGFEVWDLVKSQVKEKHSKGGWSQKRFERLREEDIKNHIEDVVKKLSELQRKYASVTKFAVLGGDAILLKQIAPAISLPIIRRNLEPHDVKRLDRLLEEIYGFTCYRA